MKVSIGISTCPNDTFAFHGIINGAVDLRGIEYEFELLDIQELNHRLFAGDFDFAKASYHAAALLANETYVLSAGSALGFGVGPLLLGSPALNADSIDSATLKMPMSNLEPSNLEPPNQASAPLALCPGQHTTATLLLKMFYPKITNVEHVVFSDIMPRLSSGSADLGVCIHEGRFTYQKMGLQLVDDLGARWEQTTNCPLPLGGILARRGVDSSVIQNVNATLRDSIRYGQENRSETLTTMRKHAQEFDDETLFQHVDLYVNQWTIDLGDEGRRSLNEFARQSQMAGVHAAESMEIAS